MHCPNTQSRHLLLADAESDPLETREEPILPRTDHLDAYQMRLLPHTVGTINPLWPDEAMLLYTARNLERKGRKLSWLEPGAHLMVRRVWRNRRNQACPHRLVDPQTQLRFPLGFFLCSPVVSPRIASGKSEEATTSDEGKTGNCL
jgi:hypothetical protein